MSGMPAAQTGEEGAAPLLHAPDHDATSPDRATGNDRDDREGQRSRPSLLGSMTRHWVSVGSIAAGFILWQLIGQFAVSNSLFLATPVQAFAAMREMAASGVLWQHIWVSGQEFLYGFTGACILGLPIGLLMASSRRIRAILSPWVSGFYATPIVALAPLLILWFGVGLASKIVVVASLVIFPVIINTEAGILATDPDLSEMAQSFGAGRLELFTKVSIPSALPFILTGFRLGIGRGLIGVVVGELFGAYAGLGFMIYNSAQVFNMPALFAGIFILAFAGVVLTAGFRLFELRVVHWQGSGRKALR